MDMSDEKRPYPILNIKPDRGRGGASPSRQPGASAASGSGMAGEQRVPPAPPKGNGSSGGGRIVSHALAGLAGGAIAAAAVLSLPSVMPQLGLAGADTQSEIRRLEDRTAALERAIRTQTASAPAASGLEAATQAINEVSGRMDTLVQRVSGIERELAETATQGGNPANPAPAALAAADVQAEAERAIAPLQTRLAALERDMDALSKAQAERQGDAKTAALAVAFTNLKRAVSDGRPYASELATVESLAPKKLALTELAAYKDAGVPTLAALTRDFPEISKRAIESHYQGNSSTFVGEMLARARSAIQITPGDKSGNSPEAVIGRMQGALRSGDLGAAVLEGSALQGRAAETMQPWLQSAQSRLVAEEALRQTDAELLAALTKPGTRR